MRRNLLLHRNPFLCGIAGRATIRSPDWPRNWGGWDPHPSQKISSQHRDRFDVNPVCAPVSPAPPASGSGGDARFASPADQNLADMAQRLEAALRRPNRNEEAAAPQPTPKPEQDVASGEEFAGSAATETSSPPPRGGAPIEAPTPPPRDETRPARNEAKAAPQQRSLYDSLEQEMASLLGRPGGKG